MKTKNKNISEKKFKKKQIRKKKVSHRKKIGSLIFNYVSLVNTIIIKDYLKAPTIFNYTKYPLECNYFFSSLRDKNSFSIIRGKLLLKISLLKTTDIDFAAISILKSIMEEARRSGISFHGLLPKNFDCKKLLLDFGFLINLQHNGNQNIKIASSGQYFSYEKKSGKLKEKDYEDFEKISFKAYKGLTGNNGYFDDIITVFKEIGSNAVEWSLSKYSQWMVGYYEKDNRVIINVTDLGSGILETLFRNGRLQLIDLFFMRSNFQILERAFLRKYGSLSQDINRNRGLPFIKKIYDEDKIKNLIVSTNNIFYNFERYNECRISPKLESNFMGTFYQWELDKQCIDNYE